MFAGASPAVPPAVAPENVVSLDRLSRLRVIDVGLASAGGLERDVSLRLPHGALRDHPVFQLLAGNLVRAILLPPRTDSSDAPRVGKKCVSSCRYRWSPFP